MRGPRAQSVLGFSSEQCARVGAREPGAHQAVSNLSLLRTNAHHWCGDRGAFLICSDMSERPARIGLAFCRRTPAFGHGQADVRLTHPHRLRDRSIANHPRVEHDGCVGYAADAKPA